MINGGITTFTQSTNFHNIPLPENVDKLSYSANDVISRNVNNQKTLLKYSGIRSSIPYDEYDITYNCYSTTILNPRYSYWIVFEDDVEETLKKNFIECTGICLPNHIEYHYTPFIYLNDKNIQDSLYATDNDDVYEDEINTAINNITHSNKKGIYDGYFLSTVDKNLFIENGRYITLKSIPYIDDSQVESNEIYMKDFNANFGDGLENFNMLYNSQFLERTTTYSSSQIISNISINSTTNTGGIIPFNFIKLKNIDLATNTSDVTIQIDSVKIKNGSSFLPYDESSLSKIHKY